VRTCTIIGNKEKTKEKKKTEDENEDEEEFLEGSQS
jgi:hypothetical protein